MKFTLERSVKVYDDQCGSYREVRPDADGLWLVEIRDCDANGNELARMVMHPQAARLLAQALVEVAEHVEAETAKEGR